MGRLRYIDLLKGIFIVLMVMRHCDCIFETSVPGLEATIMPLFFALSGLFFKSEEPLGKMVMGKINRIMVPFAFFYLSAYALFYVMKYFMPELLITEAKGVGDLFVQKRMFNDPIWYLLAVFWCFIYYGITEKIIGSITRNPASKTAITSLVIVAMTLWGNILGDNSGFLPMHMDVALSAMPFFYLGVLLKGRSFILHRGGLWRNIVLGGVFYLVALVISLNFNIRLVMSNNITSSYMIYPMAIASIVSMIFFSKAIGYIRPINYLGQNTMLILCLHQMVYRPLQVILAMQPLEFLQSPYIIASLTIGICCLFIPLFKRWAPQLIGEKDLFRATM